MVYTASQTSLVKSPSSMTEMYIPLWVYGSGHTQTSSTTSVYLQKGTNTLATVTTGSAIKLHTLSSSWSTTQQFSFEASFMSQTGGTAYLALYNTTSSSIVSASQISTTSATSTVVRSGQFTLTPGNTYGIVTWTSASAYADYCTKAHLVAFL